MAQRGLIIQPNERVTAIGKTGSGKTHLLKAYAAGFSNVMVLDTKGTFTWGKVPVIRTLDQLMKQGAGKFIYRPVDAEMNADFYDAFFEFCYKRRHTLVFVDELAQVCDSPTDILPNWKNIMQRGRELNVGIFNATQRPRGVPKMALSECEHTFCFRLKLEDDRKHVAEFMGKEIVDVQLKGHGFFYMHESYDRAIQVPNGLKI
jgi:energy-coupling factor transporter ATP-binding protein EcfA2